MSSIKEFEHLRIPLKAIKLATNNFDDNNYVSRGGFGKVYRGDLIRFGKSVTVAVKCLDRAFGQGNPEFWKEIMMLSRYKHQNLVSLLGFCDEDGESMLVYEYLPNKSLNMHLSSIELSWTQCLKICIGAAKGLQYLHDPCNTMQRLQHITDENWNAKISDFGLANFGPANQEFTFLFTHPVGSFGYCDPAYAESGFLTKESDVYSFGVVLFEVLCGRLCIVDFNDHRQFLPKLARSSYEENRVDTIVKESLLEHMSRECLRKFSTIAYQCLHKDRKQRPTFVKIVRELQIALQFQDQNQSTFPRNDYFTPITPSAEVSKDEQYPKDSVAAYRSAAAAAAARMQAASRARDFERLKKDVESSNTKKEARSIIAAMRIQNGLSLDLRDKFGWTALHWAAHYGRERMVVSLISAGANPSLVTDPTSENPNGCMPADLASKSGYYGLAGYLAEKALVAHFEAMTLAGNEDFAANIPSVAVTEDEQHLKDTLAAYRSAADAAARIQAAFREQSLKLRTKDMIRSSNTEEEARCIVAATTIQQAFRNYQTKKQTAAARIEYMFRTWKIRKYFLNKKRQVIKIQAIFRGHQIWRQYTNMVWSVGVLEKAILRWRLKQSGFQGLQVDPTKVDKDENQENNGMEDFFHASQNKQKSV
ncbi:hypothetical protein OSB04_014036 [Centaurea solstitialis]|uniref:Protein kinase domain-containing protein n=1 Tax=Centaurea solstitialis TaxID=347529 RepID=A0AA38TXE6_9ASTR|nr:hypothetical protein OSB04_014036 [Centaurea solstitialis]